jgi:hypothetical protein
VLEPPYGNLLALAQLSRPVNHGPAELIEQEIARRDGRGLTPEDQMTGKAAGSRGGRRLSAVVGLRCTPRNQGVAPLRQSLADQELELADLVAAQRQARLIVPFHEDTRTGEPFRQARKLHERGREETQRVTR